MKSYLIFIFPVLRSSDISTKYETVPSVRQQRKVSFLNHNQWCKSAAFSSFKLQAINCTWSLVDGDSVNTIRLPSLKTAQKSFEVISLSYSSSVTWLLFTFLQGANIMLITGKATCSVHPHSGGGITPDRNEVKRILATK